MSDWQAAGRKRWESGDPQLSGLSSVLAKRFFYDDSGEPFKPYDIENKRPDRKSQAADQGDEWRY